MQRRAGAGNPVLDAPTVRRVAAGARVLAPAARRERVAEERRGRVPETDELLRPVRDDDRVAAPPRRVARRVEVGLAHLPQ